MWTTKLPSRRVAAYSFIRYFVSTHSPDTGQTFIDHGVVLPSGVSPGPAAVRTFLRFLVADRRR